MDIHGGVVCEEEEDSQRESFLRLNGYTQLLGEIS